MGAAMKKLLAFIALFVAFVLAEIATVIITVGATNVLVTTLLFFAFFISSIFVLIEDK